MFQQWRQEFVCLILTTIMTAIATDLTRSASGLQHDAFYGGNRFAFCYYGWDRLCNTMVRTGTGSGIWIGIWGGIDGGIIGMRLRTTPIIRRQCMLTAYAFGLFGHGKGDAFIHSR